MGGPAPLCRLVVLAVIAFSACGDDPYPWENTAAPAPRPAVPPLSVSEEAQGSAELPADVLPAPHGGLFEKCYRGLEAEVDPVRDVTRLILACGPSTGMEPQGQGLIEGAVAPDAPVTFELPLQGNHCYRVFAVADSRVTDLDVQVRSSRGTVIASDHRSGRIAIAQPDRAFCTASEDAATIHVSSTGRGGAFAMEVLAVPTATGH